jgi:acyl-CoA thioester hydrolase
MLKTTAKFYSEIRVRYQETDKMGVAYHGNYLTWFEFARVDMLDQLGIPYIKMEEQGFMLPVIEANARYLLPCYFDDRLKIETMIKKEPRVKIQVHYNIYRADEKVCQGHTVHAFIDQNRKICKPPEQFSDALKNLFKDN